MRRNQIVLAAIFLFQTTHSLSQIRWTRDDLFLDPSGIPVDGVTSFAVADVDGDGELDFTLALDSILVLYRQIPNALPRFQKVPDYFQNIKMRRESYIAERSGVTLYDLDGDGAKNPITYQDGKFIYWRNIGTQQNPQWQADSLILPEFQANDPAVGILFKPSLGDLDGDGDADFFNGFRELDLIYFENTGTNSNPIWKRDDAIAQKFRGGFYWGMPRITDVDNDGKAEVAIVQEVESSMSIHIQRYPSLQRLDIFQMPLFLQDLEFADLNDDGWQELIALLPGAGWRIYDMLDKPEEPFWERRPYHFGVNRTKGPASPFPYDVDHDGKAEFILMNDTYNFHLDDHCFAEHLKHTEFFDMPLWQDRGWLRQRVFFYRYCRIGIADLTGRHNYILVASVGYSNWGYWFYTYRHTGGDSVFQWQSDDSLFKFFRTDSTYKAPAFADLDGDKDSDLLILHGNNFEFFENQFDGSQENWIRRDDWMSGLEVSGEHASFGDIDGDGDFEVIFGTANGKLRLFDNIGSSSQPRWRNNASIDQLHFQAHTAPTLGDFDGDGDADLLLGWAEGDSSIYVGYQYGKLAYFRNDFIVGVRESSSPATPAQFELVQNYPNPFVVTNGLRRTRIGFILREAGHMRVNIYNLIGHRKNFSPHLWLS